MTGILLSLLGGKVSAVPDPYFEYTTLLLPGNGTNGAQNNTFLDGSTNNFTITRNGNTTQGTFSPFSQTGWGNYFDGSGDYLTLASNAALAFGTGDFTFEFWLNISAHTTSDGRPLGNNTSWAANAWSLHSDHTSYNEKISFWVNNYSSSAVMLVSTTTIAIGTWYHVAVTRNGNSWRLFINGTQEGSTVTSSVGIDGGSSDDLFVGGSGAANEYINGYISNLRITKGGALYTSNFTPSTTPLTTTVSAGTVSLLTCQSNRFIDNSSNNFTITRNGDTRVVAFSPFNPSASWSAAAYGGSGYFDGTGDYIVTPTNAALSSTLLASDFTIEMWIYLLQAPSGGTIWTNSTANSDGFTSSYIYSNLSIGTGKVGVNEFTSAAGVLKLNEWTHFACVRNGATVYIYVNGVQVASGAAATYLNTSAAKPLTFGQNYQTSPTATNAYLSGIRVVSSAVYTANFTPPTAPPTAITNTSLLLNFTNAGIYDATSKNDLETVGNAQISTTQSKFGGSSMAFDGTGDGLYRPNTDLLNLGTGNFTIEFWLNFSSKTGYQTIASFGYSPIASTGWVIQTGNGDGKAVFYSTTAPSTTTVIATDTGATVNTGQWYHVAIVRNAGTTTIYRDGTSVGSGSDSTNYSSSTAVFYTGGGSNTGFNNYYLNGYIQDLRITKGYARYTSNFTAPTSPFPLL